MKTASLSLNEPELMHDRTTGLIFLLFGFGSKGGRSPVEHRGNQCIYTYICTYDGAPPPEGYSQTRPVKRRSDVLTDARTDGQIPLVFYRTLSPFGAKALPTSKAIYNE